MLANIFEKFKRKSYKKITAKRIAKENGLEYISTVTSKRVYWDRLSTSFYAQNGKYILLFPANDGTPKCPLEWFIHFDGQDEKIMDNQSSFKNITNLNEIILQMIKLYEKYIYEPIIISSYDFAIKLCDGVVPNYVGKAELVLTENSIRNSKVNYAEIAEIAEAKKFYINIFLDHFICWNFGKVISENSQLERALIDFNNLVIDKGLRKDAGPGFNVFTTEDVMHYDLKTK